MPVKDAGQFWLRYRKLAPKDLPVVLKTGIKYSTLSTWKAKKLFPRADLACLIARALGTSVEFLVTGQDENLFKKPSCRHDLLYLINHLDYESMQFLKSLVFLVEQKGAENS